MRNRDAAHRDATLIPCKASTGCGRDTQHMDLGPAIPPSIRYKCMACGAYNPMPQTLSLDSFKWEDA